MNTFEYRKNIFLLKNATSTELDFISDEANKIIDSPYMELLDFDNSVLYLESYNKIIKYLVDIRSPKQYSELIENRFKAYFNPIEFVELVKALIENKNLVGNQAEIFEDFSNYLGVDFNIKTLSQQIQAIHKRNTDTHTKFLTKAKQSLTNWIDSLAEKKGNNL